MSSDDIAKAMRGVVAVKTIEKPKEKSERRTRCKFCGRLKTKRAIFLHELSCTENPEKDKHLVWKECDKCHVNLEQRTFKSHVKSCTGDPVFSLFKIYKSALANRRLRQVSTDWTIDDEMKRRGFDPQTLDENQYKNLMETVDTYQYHPRPGVSVAMRGNQNYKGGANAKPLIEYLSGDDIVIVTEHEIAESGILGSINNGHKLDIGEVQDFIWRMREVAGLTDEFLDWTIQTMNLIK